MYYPSDCANLPGHTCQDCPQVELGKVRSLFIYKIGFTFSDPGSPAEWDAAVSAGNIIIFPATSGSTADDPKMSDGYGNTAESLNGYTITLDVHEPNFVNNINFWNAVKRSTVYGVGWVTETQVRMSSVAATFVPTAPTPAGMMDKIDINLKVKFIQKDLPVPFTKPPGVFDQCMAA